MTITQEQRELLELFCKRADIVSNSSIFKNGKIDIGFNIRWERGSPMTFKMHGPTRDNLLSIVTIVRQLYMEKESINFRKIYNVVHKYIVSRNNIPKSVIENVESAMAGFKKIEKTTHVNLIIGEKKLFPKDIIDIWFNGNIFHADMEKVKKYDFLRNSSIGLIAESIFISTIVNLANLMIYFSQLIRNEILSKG